MDEVWVCKDCSINPHSVRLYHTGTTAFSNPLPCSLFGTAKSLFSVPSPAISRAAEQSGGQKRPVKAGTGATRSPAQPDEHGEAPPLTAVSTVAPSIRRRK
jgi:hypothetical protein